MSDRGPRSVPDHIETAVEVRLLRLKEGEHLWVRTLTESYGGCYTHFHKGRSHYCPGPVDCQIHKVDIVWKGYCAVEWWDVAAWAWMPAVLEVTESLDSDMKQAFARGQVWDLQREVPARKGKRSPCRAVLREATQANGWPVAFNIRPILQRLYHVTEIKLDKENPIPARVMVQPSKADKPKQSAEKNGDKSAAKDETSKIRALLDGVMNRSIMKED